MVGLAFVIVAVTTWVLARTQWGREIRAVAFDRETASILGVDVDRVSAGMFFVSGAMAGVAASFVAMAFNVMDAGLGSSYLVIALAAMVVGGFGSIPGNVGRWSADRRRVYVRDRLRVEFGERTRRIRPVADLPRTAPKGCSGCGPS